MNYERFTALLNGLRYGQTSAEVETHVAELHRMTDHGDSIDRIKAEEAIMAARQRVGTLPAPTPKGSGLPCGVAQIGASGKAPQPTPSNSYTPTNFQFVATLALNDVETLKMKGESYGESWRSRGGVGAFMMLARKWDRIENVARNAGYDIFKAAAPSPLTLNDVLDDIADLRCYLLLVEEHVRASFSPKVVDDEEGGPTSAYVNQ